VVEIVTPNKSQCTYTQKWFMFILCKFSTGAK
jgi:hypothetical protein